MKKQAKRIPVHSEGTSMAGRIPVEHHKSQSVDSAIVQSEPISVAHSARSERDNRFELGDWMDYFAPSIEGLLPSSEQGFVPKIMSIEMETIHRDQDDHGQDESAMPRRVRVTRRRVTLVGAV